MLHERHLRSPAPEVWPSTPVKSFKDNVKFCFICDCGISLIIFDELNDIRTKLQALTLRQFILTVLKKDNSRNYTYEFFIGGFISISKYGPTKIKKAFAVEIIVEGKQKTTTKQVPW